MSADRNESALERIEPGPPPWPGRYPRSYLELQVEFAAKVASASNLTLSAALLGFTNLYRIFGLGWERSASHPIWQDFVRSISQSSDAALRACETYEARYHCVNLDPDDETWGCFSYWYDESEKSVRLHFSDRDLDGVSPLAQSRLQVRRAELRSMFTAIARRHPEARMVRGASWIYHLRGYRRIFPPLYTVNRTQVTPNYQARSVWGQFLRSGFRLNEGTARILRHRISKWRKGDDLASCFPYSVLGCFAEICVFYDFFDDPPARTE